MIQSPLLRNEILAQQQFHTNAGWMLGFEVRASHHLAAQHSRPSLEAASIWDSYGTPEFTRLHQITTSGTAMNGAGFNRNNKWP